MKIRNPWRRELILLAGWLALAAAIGALADATAVGLVLALVMYLALQLVYAFQLYQWLLSDRIEPAYGAGVWQEIYTALYRLKQRDVGRRKRLRRMVAEFQASTAALPDGAVVLDSALRIVWFNDAASMLLGLKQPDDRGQRIANLLRHPAFSEYLRGSDDTRAGIEITAPGNAAATLWVQRVPYGNGQRLLIARDVTQQKRLDSMRRDFVANASHELRTPLTVLRGYVEMMEADSGAGAELAAWRDPLAQMSAEARRMDRLIDDLMELTRIESEPVPGDQAWLPVAEHVASVIARLAADGAAIVDDCEPGLELYANAKQLESVVTNLLTNARRHTPATGSITVGWHASANGAELTVADTGCGIPAEHIPRLTERFYRVDTGRSAGQGGTGLGLAIVKHALAAHAGALQVESTLGQGSIFRCVFANERIGRSPVTAAAR